MSGRFVGRSWGLFGFAVTLFVVGGCGGTVVTSDRHGDGGGSGNGGGTGDGNASGFGGTGARGGKGGTAGRGGTAGKGGSTNSGGAFCSSGTYCGGTCVDLSTDTANCGQCFSSCNGACEGGACVTTQACQPGTTWCQGWGRCLDLSNNSFACGACNAVCEGGQVCSDGKCQVGQCLLGNTWCDNSQSGTHCVNLSSDLYNCGTCGTTCDSASSCIDGKCTPPDCGPGYSFCPSYGCTDTSTDVSNCGGCSHTCGGSFSYGAYTCNAGACGCAPTALQCGKACASQFWYCPSSSSSQTPQEQCLARARNGYEKCACTSCLDTVTACADSPSCVNAMDCSLGSICVGCGTVLTDCSDFDGKLDPTAQKLVQCINDKCQAP